MYMQTNDKLMIHEFPPKAENSKKERRLDEHRRGNVWYAILK